MGLAAGFVGALPFVARLAAFGGRSTDAAELMGPVPVTEGTGVGQHGRDAVLEVGCQGPQILEIAVAGDGGRKRLLQMRNIGGEIGCVAVHAEKHQFGGFVMERAGALDDQRFAGACVSDQHLVPPNGHCPRLPGGNLFGNPRLIGAQVVGAVQDHIGEDKIDHATTNGRASGMFCLGARNLTQRAVSGNGLSQTLHSIAVLAARRRFGPLKRGRIPHAAFDGGTWFLGVGRGRPPLRPRGGRHISDPGLRQPRRGSAAGHRGGRLGHCGNRSPSISGGTSSIGVRSSAWPVLLSSGHSRFSGKWRQRDLRLIASHLLYSPWKVGRGRAARQPGQVRKEAAVTSFARVACPAFHPAL